MQPKTPSFSTRLCSALEDLWIAIFSWIPTPLGLLVRWLFWRWIFFKCGLVRFETGSSFSHCRNIQLGTGVRIAKGCFISAGHGKLVIGDDTSISSAVHLGADDGVINIGCQVGVGPGTVIRASNHRFKEADVPFLLQGHESGQIDIGDDVWIGANCVITPNVRIGRGAVVGAGAVVTHDVAPFSIVAGVPAKVIGLRSRHEA